MPSIALAFCAADFLRLLAFASGCIIYAAYAVLS